MNVVKNGNGHSDGNGFSHLTLEAALKLYNKNKRPGRPSPEQRALREYIDSLGDTAESDEPKNGKNSIEVLDQQPTSKIGRGKGRAAMKAKGDEVKITVPNIQVGVITAKVAGTQPLIMHAWDTKSKRQIEEKQQKKANRTREARNPDAEWNAARYLDSKGRDCIPARHFKNAMVEAATFLPDVTKKLIKGAIYVQGDLIPIEYDGVRAGRSIVPHKREDMVRIGGMSKTADIRYRPMYPNWTVSVTIEFDTSAFSAEQVVNLLNRAGFNVGVGEWRPTFGRFRVVKS